MFPRIALIAASSVLITWTPASAVSGDFGVDIYMSAPTVQGTAITTGLSTESFNLISTGTCPASIGIGSIIGNCSISSAGDYGGASANVTDATPTTGGAGSNYAFTSSPTQEISITLSEPAKYLGFWWSAGTSSNEVELYSGSERVAYVSTATIITLLGSATVDSMGESTYQSVDYYGNPRNGASAGEPYLYLNLYGTGGAEFDRIVLSGGGFEFDNIAVSDLSQIPDLSEVPVTFVPGENEPEPDTEPLANTGIGEIGYLGLGLAAVVVGFIARHRRLT